MVGTEASEEASEEFEREREGGKRMARRGRSIWSPAGRLVDKESSPSAHDDMTKPQIASDAGVWEGLCRGPSAEILRDKRDGGDARERGTNKEYMRCCIGVPAST